MSRRHNTRTWVKKWLHCKYVQRRCYVLSDTVCSALINSSSRD